MSFTCPICGRVSHHPEDERQRYCAVCGFVDDLAMRMRACRFDTLVVIETRRAGTVRNVGSVREAAECLVAGWPPPRGPAYIAAARACHACLSGEAPTEPAREAFIAAVRARPGFSSARRRPVTGSGDVHRDECTSGNALERIGANRGLRLRSGLRTGSARRSS